MKGYTITKAIMLKHIRRREKGVLWQPFAGEHYTRVLSADNKDAMSH